MLHNCKVHKLHHGWILSMDILSRQSPVPKDARITNKNQQCLCSGKPKDVRQGRKSQTHPLNYDQALMLHAPACPFGSFDLGTCGYASEESQGSVTWRDTRECCVREHSNHQGSQSPSCLFHQHRAWMLFFNWFNPMSRKLRITHFYRWANLWKTGTHSGGLSHLYVLFMHLELSLWEGRYSEACLETF